MFIILSLSLVSGEGVSHVKMGPQLQAADCKSHVLVK